MEYTLTCWPHYKDTQGWPHYKENVKLAARDFLVLRNELRVHEGLLLREDRIVIPHSTRKEILERIHDGHLGISKCRERAQQGVWWPHISKDIKNIVSDCRFCLEKQPTQQKQPLLVSPLPDRPFQRGVDISETKGKHYLISVDYYSRWTDISTLNTLTSVARHFRNNRVRQWSTIFISRVQEILS